MTSVTLTSGVTSVIITGTIGYNTQFDPVALNSKTIKSPTGAIFTYHSAVVEIIGNLEVKGVSYTQGNALRDFIIDTLEYKSNSFTISAISNTDLGTGKNTQVTGAVFWGENSLKEVLQYSAPGIYHINFPYRFVRS